MWVARFCVGRLVERLGVPQVEVPDQRDAKYVEAQIPFRDMMAFVAEQPEDLSKFLGLVRDGQGLRINGVVVPAEPLDAFQPRLPLAQIGWVLPEVSRTARRATR